MIAFKFGGDVLRLDMNSEIKTSLIVSIVMAQLLVVEHTRLGNQDNIFSNALYKLDRVQGIDFGIKYPPGL